MRIHSWGNIRKRRTGEKNREERRNRGGEGECGGIYRGESVYSFFCGFKKREIEECHLDTAVAFDCCRYMEGFLLRLYTPSLTLSPSFSFSYNYFHTTPWLQNICRWDSHSR